MGASRATTDASDPSPPRSGWADLLTGGNAALCVALAGGVALHAVNVYVATTILPSVVDEIGGLDLYAWNTALFVVASIAGAAVSAPVLQRVGPRSAYSLAAAVFACGTLICAFAPTMWLMLLGRLVQGGGGGLLFALSYALIRVTFAERLWPRAMALVSGMWGVATLVGPAVGGVFAEAGIWRWAFGSMVPLTAAFAWLALTVLPGRNDEPPTGDASLPVTQLLLLVGAVLAVSVGSLATGPAWTGAGVTLAIVLGACIVAVDRRSTTRLLPRGSFDWPGPLFALFATMSLLAMSVTSSEVYVPLFLQTLHGASPLTAGYLAALMAAGWTLGSLAISGAGRAGADRAIRASPVLAFVGMALLATLVPEPSGGGVKDLTAIGLALVAVGAGVGIGWPHLLTRVLQSAPADEQALASASLTTVQLVSTAVGAALAGMVANSAGLADMSDQPTTASAARWLFAIFAIAPLLGVTSARRVARTT